MRPAEEYRKLHYERNITFPLLRLNYKRFILESPAPASSGWIWGIILLGLIHDKLCCLRSSIWSRLVMRLSGRLVLYGNITIAATSGTRIGLNRFIVSYQHYHYQQHQKINFSNIKYFVILLCCLTSIIIKKKINKTFCHPLCLINFIK